MTLLIALFATASGQTFDQGAIPDINAQYFRPSLDANRTFWTDDTSLSEQLLSPKILVHYTDQPLIYTFNNGTELPIVGGVAQADLMLSATFSRYRIGVDVPIYLVADGVAAGSEFGLGDLAFDGKAVVLDGAEDDAPVGFALSGRVFLPTATVQNALGAPNVGWEVAAIVDKRFIDDKALLAANVAYRGGPDTQLENVRLNDYLAWRAGGAYDVSSWVAVSAELVGGYDLWGGNNLEALPMEAMFGGHFMTGDTSIRLGAGPGLTPGIGAPDWRAVLGIDFMSKKSEPDTDGDGLVDSLDKCPTVPEDMDGVLDDDGCVDAPTPIHVKVVDAAGKEVSGAVVAVTLGETPVPEGDGPANFAVEPGAYSATATAAGYKPGAITFEAGPAEEAKVVTVQLAPVTGTLKVSVVDEAGAPLKARVYFGGDEVGDGPDYEGMLPVREGRALARLDGYKVAFADVAVVEDKVTEVKLVMVPSKADLVGDKIDIKDSVYFDTGKATIQARSNALLDEVTQIMTDHPELTKLRVEGHTDSRGSASSNKTLSQKRADAVLAYLTGKGVETTRLSAVGYGEEKPIDKREVAEAWEKNRRVDFFVEERAD
jgi:outer membrane protein OmpA-like peptidoglycan-associated protein